MEEIEIRRIEKLKEKSAHDSYSHPDYDDNDADVECNENNNNKSKEENHLILVHDIRSIIIRSYPRMYPILICLF